MGLHGGQRACGGVVAQAVVHGRGILSAQRGGDGAVEGAVVAVAQGRGIGDDVGVALHQLIRRPVGRMRIEEGQGLAAACDAYGLSGAERSRGVLVRQDDDLNLVIGAESVDLAAVRGGVAPSG
ncbi:hypothetical protein AZH45_04745 [Corynebacterium striatum]|nr:hypothetical protein AZH45_04745 [Corynebacterium striatum]